MIQSGKVKNVLFFLILFLLILGINLGVLNYGFSLMSFAQEMEKTEETVEAQETPAAEQAVGVEETEKTEEEEEAETEEELDISLIAEYITYEKVADEDLG